ncbi:MAG: Gfo/Idh/MocA family oxidoreductase [Acidobacteria bacterium]|nr:Gfo/Idh/MocA family oxidoreductase [Acidobacteriota bacterium]
MKPIKVGLVGLGVMGRQHLRVLRDLAEFQVVAVSDPRIDEYGDLVGLGGEIGLHRSHVGLLEEDLDAVVIASPTSFHVSQSLDFLERDVHVLLEKPIAPDVNSAIKLVDAAAKSSAIFLVGHIERFNPAVDAVRSIIDRGNLGNILSISARRVGVARPAVPATNVITDLGIHDIDTIQLLTGARPIVMGATGGALPGNLDEDYAFIWLTYGKVTAAVETNWITPLKSRRLSVTGTGGFVDLDYVRQEVTVYQGQVDSVDSSTTNFRAIWQTAEGKPLWVNQGEPLRRELMHFANCILGEDTPSISTEEAFAALAACQNATEIIRQKVSSTPND